MENSINGTKNIIIEVNKVPPPDEDPKKRPKPKNMNPDEIVPVYMGLLYKTKFIYDNPNTEMEICYSKSQGKIKLCERFFHEYTTLISSF